MKKYLFILLSVLILLPHIAFGQDNCDISLGIYFDNDCPEMTLQNKNYLKNILNKALTEQSATSLDNSQFGILVNADINDKHIINGAPTKTVLNLYITFSLTDIKTGKMFKSISMDVNGVGNSEGKAFNNAIHKLKSQNKNIQDFSSNAKTVIIEYYNKNYNSIIKNAEAQAALRNYEEALYNLMCIPVCCTGYDQAMTIVRKIYKQYIDQHFYGE